MAYVVHKTTYEYRKGVNTPDYDSETWLINPDLSNVAGVSPQYWKTSTGDVIVEMTQAEKDVVDNKNQPNFLVQETSSGLVLNETWYAYDNGDGTYSGKVVEIIYNYSDNKLINRTENNYIDTVLHSTDQYNYFTNEDGDLITKKV